MATNEKRSKEVSKEIIDLLNKRCEAYYGQYGEKPPFKFKTYRSGKVVCLHASGYTLHSWESDEMIAGSERYDDGTSSFVKPLEIISECKSDEELAMRLLVEGECK